MWKINKFALALVAIPFIIIGVLFIILSFNTDPNARTGDGYPLRTFYLIFGCFFIILILGIVAGIVLVTYRQQRRIEWFKKFGIPAEAEIISAEQTGVYINKLPQVQLKLNVSTGMGSPYMVTIKKVFTYQEIGKLLPGTKLRALVHPQKPHKILLL